MNKYIIFEKDLKSMNGEIKSWAPENSEKRIKKGIKGLECWKEVNNIKKGDKIYFVSNKILVAIGKAIEDAKSCNHADLYNTPKGNPDWSDAGYGVISKITKDYEKYGICITEEIEKYANKIADIKPFEIRNGHVSAHQSGYCYPLSEKLQKFIDEIILSYVKNPAKSFTDSKFVYTPIDLKKQTKEYGTSAISTKKINKGKIGEEGVNEFLKTLDFDVDDVSENSADVADLIIKNEKVKYSLEIKNISNQDNKHYIYLSDNQIKALLNGETRLCLYFEGDIYLSNKSCKEKFFKEIMDVTNKSRKYVIDSFYGKFCIADLAILIDRDVIENNFILINSLTKAQLLKELGGN